MKKWEKKRNLGKAEIQKQMRRLTDDYLTEPDEGSTHSIAKRSKMKPTEATTSSGNPKKVKTPKSIFPTEIAEKKTSTTVTEKPKEKVSPLLLGGNHQ